ncbi:hypothetical protein B0T26DRAFT_676265 [Lasiosphaeria miniovina]|uniref:Autophagy-related protein 33 n=1 Tax=Lasiosphaeria miniovina TaxID=1954250 RepID=A0AA40ALG7_9PEZI|nr:uncharacterized protein B0T26DRAFT_676265 [Lasiosphaeria miniovina]KAK0718046.1 hypothetical protein B0T26DRAFT_676265 [Lasiosphaeria miniovina]
MAARGPAVLKFVGTVSLGLLTFNAATTIPSRHPSDLPATAVLAHVDGNGLSYTLSTLTIPTLLGLPSASAAVGAFDSLTASAKKHLHTLTTVSASAFTLAYLLSPRAARHPYLIYTSILVLGSRLAISDLAAPYLSLGPAPASSSSSSSAAAAAAARKQKKNRAAAAAAAARARMEASYEVLHAASDEAASEEGTTGSDDAAEADDETLNGEEVRVKVEAFLKKQMVQTTVAGLAFAMAVVGIWGDGVATLYKEAFIIEL